MEKNNLKFYKICNLPTDHLKYDEVIKKHIEAIDGDKFYYLDPISGIEVFTAKFLFEYGGCCGSGCRHCPYSSEDL